jgi:6-phosphogluconate dehydrogenase
VDKVDQFLGREAKGTNVIGAHSLEELVQKLKKPRRVMMLVKAGEAVDDFIGKLVNTLYVVNVFIGHLIMLKIFVKDGFNVM